MNWLFSESFWQNVAVQSSICLGIIQVAKTLLRLSGWKAIILTIPIALLICTVKLPAHGLLAYLIFAGVVVLNANGLFKFAKQVFRGGKR